MVGLKIERQVNAFSWPPSSQAAPIKASTTSARTFVDNSRVLVG